MKVDLGATQERLKVVNYGDIQGRTHLEREVSISLMQTKAKKKDGSSLHLVYDRRLYPEKKPAAENAYLIWPTLLQHCAKVTIINEDGSEEIIKQRA